MRKILLQLSLFLTLALSASSQMVRLYEDCYYGGRAVSLPAGNYASVQHGLRIRALSSIEIPAGFTVNLFSRDYFNGQYISLSATSPCLVDQHFNDMMVSLQVIDDRASQPSAVTAPVRLFNRCSYLGTTEELYEGTYAQTGMGFAGIQSISVAPGFAAIFRKEVRVGYSVNVTQEEVRGDKSCLPLYWGNTVKSVYIYRLDNVYDDYWNSTPAQISTFNHGAVAFSDVNFRGRAQMLNPGAYRSYQLSQVGAFNMSSIRLSSGYEAILFSGENFNGASLLVSASNANLHLGAVNWGNRAGSVIIQRVRQTMGNTNPVFNPPVVAPPPPPPPPVRPQPVVTPPPPPPTVPVRPQPNVNSPDFVIAYMDANYQGANIALPVGSYRSHELPGVGPRTISSMRIPAGMRVTVYDGIAFNGDYRILTYSIDNFVTEGGGRWNDRISSIIVEKIQQPTPR